MTRKKWCILALEGTCNWSRLLYNQTTSSSWGI